MMASMEVILEYTHVSGRVVSVVVNPLDPHRHNLRLVNLEPHLLIVVPGGAIENHSTEWINTVTRTLVDQVIPQL